MILIDSEEIEAIITPTWDTLVGLPMVRTDAPRSTGLTWRATIAFDGPVVGAVHLELPAALAVQVACEMFATDEVADDEISDAIGELANVLGGNLKACIATGVAMGLPRVDAPFEVAPTPPERPGNVTFSCNNHVFVVSVHLAEGNAPA